jgi:hypothetical protein
MEWSGSEQDPAPAADPTSGLKSTSKAACEAAVQTVWEEARPATCEGHNSQGKVQHAEVRPVLLKVPHTDPRPLLLPLHE